MSKGKTKEALFVKYDGIRTNLQHQSSSGVTYNLQKGVWHEVSELDYEIYASKAKANDTWEVKRGKIPVMNTYHYVKWLGSGARQLLTLDLYDKDTLGNVILNTLRPYQFTRYTWVLIDDKDIATFSQKANANEGWEHQKGYLQDGYAAPKTLGGLNVQQHFTIMMKEKPEEPPKETIVQKVTKKVKKVIPKKKEEVTDKDVVAPSAKKEAFLDEIVGEDDVAEEDINASDSDIFVEAEPEKTKKKKKETET